MVTAADRSSLVAAEASSPVIGPLESPVQSRYPTFAFPGGRRGLVADFRASGQVVPPCGLQRSRGSAIESRSVRAAVVVIKCRRDGLAGGAMATTRSPVGI